jgi:hypothetical protein
MTPQEYQQLLSQWQNFSTTNFNNDEVLKAAAAKNTNWSNIYSGSRDLGGTTLTGSDAKLVSQYFSAKGYNRNEEWIRSNADSYWQRQLRDAQNWALQNDKTQGLYQAELQGKNALVKQNEMQTFQKGIETKQTEVVQKLQDSYTQNNVAQQETLKNALAQLQQAQENASRAASEQEAKRVQQENLRIQEQGRQSVTNTASRSLQGVDADRYQGELQQYGTQADYIRNQLASAGIDQGFLSNYGIDAKANQANQWADRYNSARSQAPDSLIGKYGGVSQAQQALEQEYSQAQTGLLDYDSQVRNSLSQLGTLYNSFNRLGDINSVTGNTGQERVASLFGVQKIDTSGVQKELGTQQEAYNRKLSELSSLVGGSEEVLNQYRNPFDTIVSSFNQQNAELGNVYQQGANQLYNLYGNAEAMSSGRAFNVASQQQGLLSSGATKLGSTLGQVSNLSSNLVSKYNETANALRNQRTTERNAYYSNEARRQFNEQQSSQLNSYAGKIGNQLNKRSTVNEDPENTLLNRYSLFA